MGAILGAAAIGAAGTIGGAYMQSQNGPGSPAKRNLLGEYWNNYLSQYDIAGPVVNAEWAYRPQYGAMDESLMERALLGGKGWTRTDRVQLSENEYQKEYQKRFGRLAKSPGEAMRELGPMFKDVQVRVPGQRGMLNIFKRALPQISQLQRKSRGEDVATAMQMWNRVKASDPETQALLDSLTAQANEGLAAGTRLSPAEAREVQQHVRSGQAARGMGYGGADLVAEALAMGSRGRELQDDRRQFAAGVYGLRAEPEKMVYQAGMSTPGAMGATGTFLDAALGMSRSAGPKLFNVESPYANSVYGGNMGASNDFRLANSQHNSAVWGGALSGLGNLGASYLYWKGAQPAGQPAPYNASGGRY